MVVGASVAGVRVVQALRRGGYDGPLVLIDREFCEPYDKPALSKTALTDGGPPPSLTTDSEFEELAVDFRAGWMADGLDLEAGRVLIRGEEPVPFAYLVITTGSRPLRLPAFEGIGGIYYVRTRADATALRTAFTRGGRVVVVGAGFIGGEVASSARSLGLDVTIVEAGSRPLARVMPAQVSDAITGLHRDHGVEIICGKTVIGHNGGDSIDSVVLNDGSVLPADIVVVGIGTVPDTGWLEKSGLLLDDGVLCTPALTAEGHNEVYVAGDAVRWRNPSTGLYERAEHWTSAREQAGIVAHNLMAHGPSKHFTTIPYVWSDQCGVQIQHVGRSTPDLLTVERPTSDGKGQLFVHLSGDTVVGATAFDAPRDLLTFRRSLAGR